MAEREAFVAVPMVSAAASVGEHVADVRLSLQARLPNGVVFDLREVPLPQAVELVEALGRVRCSASTKP